MRLAIFALASLGLFACSGGYATYAPMKSVPARPPKNPDSVVLLGLGERPACDYVVAGIVEGKGGDVRWNAGVDVAAKHIKQTVAEQGLDGVIDMRCAMPGTVDYERGTCAGQAYFCR
jgi:hypothetical protein